MTLFPRVKADALPMNRNQYYYGVPRLRCLFVTSEKGSKPFVDKGFFCLPSGITMKLMLISLFSALAIASPAFAGRKVVQIAAQGDRIYVLCDDGTVWWAINAGPSVPKPIWNEIETPP